ncbi:histidine utilization repressor [Asticcacaulis tiandongensis]|uniref:histidine utilization repressor n=1 Tax=Asticcacaulis tiandongensis TaxID=2565365 RepID=UPI00112DAC87|nr:histidine utilization repressor [Asticcacaulis tiandongensis]
MNAPVSNLPLHQQIHQDIEQQIRSGILSPGDKIPFEHELMETYGCSRMTVNKALSRLTTSGLIERRKRAGSFVRLPKLDSTVLDIPDIEAEILARGETYGFELLHRSVHRADTPDECELAGIGGQVLFLRGLHLASGRPLVVEERLINLETVPAALTVDFTDQSPGHWLLEVVPWTQVESQISAINATDDIAAWLQGDKGMACLEVERRTWRGYERITTVTQIYDGARYSFTARFDHD